MADAATRWSRWGLGLFALFFVLCFAPFIGKIFQRDAAPSLPLGEVVASAVYAGDGGGLRMLRVTQSVLLQSQQSLFQVLHNDLQAKQLIFEPQTLQRPYAPGRTPAQMRVSANQQIDLLLQAREWWRWNSKRQQFEPMNEALAQRFAAQLGTGIAQAAFGGGREPGLLAVTSNTGDRYAVYWDSGEIFRWGEHLQQLRERRWAQNSATASRIDYAEFRTDVAKYGVPRMLLHYQQKLQPGGFELLPQLVVHSSSDALVRAAPKRFQAVSEGFVVDRQSLQEAGITQVAQVPKLPVQFAAEVLARNADRVLLRYEPRLNAPNEAELALLDARSLLPLWIRPVSEFPQLLQHGRQLAAQGFTGGFYLTTVQSLPALVLGNDGAVLQDFRPQERVPAPGGDGG